MSVGITFLALLGEASALRGVGAIRAGVGKSGRGLVDDGAAPLIRSILKARPH
jgi:hypothetical protein